MVETVFSCCLRKFRGASVSKNTEISLEPYLLFLTISYYLLLVLFARADSNLFVLKQKT